MTSEHWERLAFSRRLPAGWSAHSVFYRHILGVIKDQKAVFYPRERVREGRPFCGQGLGGTGPRMTGGCSGQGTHGGREPGDYYSFIVDISPREFCKEFSGESGNLKIYKKNHFSRPATTL